MMWYSFFIGEKSSRMGVHRHFLRWDVSKTLAYWMFVFVSIFRPTGLLGRPEIEKV